MPGIRRRSPSRRLPPPLPLRHPPAAPLLAAVGRVVAGVQPLDGADAAASLLPRVRLLALGSTSPTR